MASNNQIIPPTSGQGNLKTTIGSTGAGGINLTQPDPSPIFQQGNNTQVNQIIFEQAQQLAQQIVESQNMQKVNSSTGKIFTYLDFGEDIITDQKQIITNGLWSNNNGTLTTFFSSSLETETQKKYYLDAYDLNPADDNDAEAQFSIAFGHKYGSGSESDNYRYASKAIYAQYKNLLLSSPNELFTFGDGTVSDKIYVLSIERERMKDKLNTGNWQLHLAELDGAAKPNDTYTGNAVAVKANAKIVSLVDTSVSNITSISSNENEYYYVVSGSIAGGIYTGDEAIIHYGIVYPKKGIIVLNGNKLNTELGFNTVTGSDMYGDNNIKLFKSISGSAHIDLDYAFIARSEEEIASTYYFIRARNSEYNYSNNRSYMTGSLGELKHKTFIQDPKTYITEIGLYNDDNELLAIAKTSQPIQKSFNKEVSFTVKLDF